MKLYCVVKFIPDVDRPDIKQGGPVSIRNDCQMQLNPDDACALGLALRLKKSDPDISVHLVTVGSENLSPLVEDLLRVGIDHATILTQSDWESGDALFTARQLAHHLQPLGCDVVLTGSRARDGGTASVPPMLAELLGMEQLTGIAKVEDPNWKDGTVAVEQEFKGVLSRYELTLPAILSINQRSGYPLPFVRLKDKKLDVSGRVTILNCEQMDDPSEGKLNEKPKSRIVSFRAAAAKIDKPLVVEIDDAGIDAVIHFLKDNQYL